ncbi:hypothetical protein [Paenibacillus macerans]
MSNYEKISQAARELASRPPADQIGYEDILGGEGLSRAALAAPRY